MTQTLETPVVRADPLQPQPQAPRGKPLAGPRVVVAVTTAALVHLGLVLRVWLLRTPAGHLNSDEAHTGIQALEFAVRGLVWVFVPGNAYGGNVEAWLDGPFAAFLGPSAMRLKLQTTEFWLAATIVVYAALRRRLGFGAALFGAAVMWLPGAAMVQLSTLAYPGYAAGILATAVVVALASPMLEGPASAWRCLWVGVAAGLAVWQHPLYLQAVLPFALALAVKHRRRVISSWLPMLAGGLASLAVPVVYNLRLGFPSLQPPRSTPPISYATRVNDWFGDVFPRVIGMKWIDDVWILGPTGIALTILTAFGLFVASALVLHRGPLPAKVAAIATLCAPLTIPLFRSTWFTQDARYAAMALVPAAVVVAHAVSRAPALVRDARPAAVIAAWALLTVVVPFAHHFGASAVDPNEDLHALVRVLDDNAVTRVRADYWISYRLAYETGDRIEASPIEPVKFERYESSVAAAEASGRAALVVFADRGPDVMMGAAPYQAYGAFRPARRVHVAKWTVFLPPASGVR